MVELASSLDITMPQLAVAWCLRNDNVSTVILGASKKSQLVDTLGSVDKLDLLTDDVMNTIEEILQNKPAHPPF